MPNNRIGRINEEIQRELAALIPTGKAPNVVKPANPANEHIVLDDEED